jgi:hypothetical protein
MWYSASVSEGTAKLHGPMGSRNLDSYALDASLCEDRVIVLSESGLCKIFFIESDGFPYHRKSLIRTGSRAVRVSAQATGWTVLTERGETELYNLDGNLIRVIC